MDADDLNFMKEENLTPEQFAKLKRDAVEEMEDLGGDPYLPPRMRQKKEQRDIERRERLERLKK